MNRALRPILTLLALLLLQACSTIKLGYQQLPNLSYWWLDRTVSFSGLQSDEAKGAIDRVYQWHRQEALPDYAKLLQRTTQLSAGTVQSDQLCQVVNEAQTQLDVLMRQAVVHAAPVAMVLGPKQLSHMAKHWERKNEAWEKEWLQGDSAARLARRVDKALDRYTSFYGELRSEQIVLITNQLAQSPWRAEWGRRDRQRRQQDLLSALQLIQQNNLSRTQAEAQLWGVWQRWLQPPDAEQRNVIQGLAQRTCDNLAQLHNTTTPEQRSRLAKRLQAYERDMLDLMRPL
jgi:hypothetical protein